MKPGTRILLVEDDRSIAGFVEPELERLGFDVRCAYDGPSGLEELRWFGPGLILLDIMLPGLDGVAVLKTLREAGSRVPVIMLTARDTTLDKVHSLDRDADDSDQTLRYRGAPGPRPRAPEAGGGRGGAQGLRPGGEHRHPRGAAGEREIELTAREYELLEFMSRRPRRVLSRDLLLSQVWGHEFGIETNVVDVYVGYLRKKVDSPGEPKLIRTIRGAGYVLRGG